MLHPIWSNVISCHPHADGRLSKASSPRALVLMMHTTKAVVLECAGGNDWHSEYTRFNLVFPSLVVVQDCWSDVLVRMGPV